MRFGGFTPFTLIDYPGKTAAMVYTVGCNFRCPYCHNPELVEETAEDIYTDEFVLDFLEGRKGMIDGLVITGGEPTMHGEKLLEFMRRVKQRGFLIKLDTNGTDPEFIRTAVQRGLIDYVAMDIKAPLVNYHRVVGRPVDIEAIRTSITFLQYEHIPYEFRTTVIKGLLSEQELEEIAREISGAKCYYLQLFNPTKTLEPSFRSRSAYDKEDMARFQKTASRYVEFCGLR